MVAYASDPSSLEPDQLRGFFGGWPKRPSPEKHLALLRASDAVELALDGDRVVGFATAVSDGVLAGYVPLLEVLPDYRGRGIGTALMRRLLARLDQLYMVDIVCDAELVPFYERLGLAELPRAVGRRNPDAL